MESSSGVRLIVAVQRRRQASAGTES